MRPIIFINSHPIQYFAPLYKYLNDNGLDVSCWYCSDENLKDYYVDQQFNVKVSWDIPLLEGYKHKFYKNNSLLPSIHNGFFGIANIGLIADIFKEQKSVIVVHGWNYLTNVVAIVLGRLAGHTICLRGENPLNQEMLKGRLLKYCKHVFLGLIIFRFTSYCLYIGSQNFEFYKKLRVPRSKLVFMPYAVDNNRFLNDYKKLFPLVSHFRSEMAIPIDAKVFLFSAKFIEKKRPMDMIRAFAEMKLENKFLVMVGDGKMLDEAKTLASSLGIEGIRFTGFVNQSAISKYYVIADVFVLPSGEGETWGLAINEALNFDLPCVVSRIAGCANDLIQEGSNGYTFNVGDIEDLSLKMKMASALGRVSSAQILEKFSFYGILASVKEVSNG